MVLIKTTEEMTFIFGFKAMRAYETNTLFEVLVNK